jgi:general secretion pathway protein G
MFSPKKSGAFTLIELLVVIAIIAILAALVLNTAGYIQKKAARARAEAEIGALSTALESYKVEYGDYPTASGSEGISASNNANILYQALVLSNATYNPSGKVFFEPSKGNSSTTNYTSPGNYFVDPFGQPYQYKYPGDANRSGTNFFDLWSFGGVSGSKTNISETWVKNW